jgi:ribonuclease-3
LSYTLLEKKLGYTFRGAQLLEVALTHKSFLNENPDCGRSHNERLEFLGDAVIDLAVGHLLMEREPNRSEGELSRRRATVVSEPSLALVARELDLGPWLFLGRGEEQSGGRAKSSVLADALEAVFGAIYLDGGFVAAHQAVGALFASRIASAGRAANEDWKTRLQESAARRKLTVRYELIDTSGPEHDKRFSVAALIGDVVRSRGQGKSKKEAEQKAAESALTWMNGLDAAQQEGQEAAPEVTTPSPPRDGESD